MWIILKYKLCAIKLLKNLELIQLVHDTAHWRALVNTEISHQVAQKKDVS